MVDYGEGCVIITDYGAVYHLVLDKMQFQKKIGKSRCAHPTFRIDNTDQALQRFLRSWPCDSRTLSSDASSIYLLEGDLVRRRVEDGFEMELEIRHVIRRADRYMVEDVRQTAADMIWLGQQYRGQPLIGA